MESTDCVASNNFSLIFTFRIYLKITCYQGGLKCPDSVSILKIVENYLLFIGNLEGSKTNLNRNFWYVKYESV